MRYIIAVIMCALGITSVSAGTITMFGQSEYGFNQPKYRHNEGSGKKKLLIKVLGENNNFPLSSEEQGSIFNIIFDEAFDKTPIDIAISYKNNYEGIIKKFEREGKQEEMNAYFSYYNDYPYYANKFIYPAFFNNNVHIITTLQNKLNLKSKNELKEYKGIYAKTDKMADFVIKEFKLLNLAEVENLSNAFELLLTGKADFIAANYYSSQIEAYKLGIHDYIAYSTDAVWKQPMFLRVDRSIMRSPYIKELQKILNNQNYETLKEKAFENLLNTYKENTRGIVPPTYTRVEEEQTENTQKAEEEK